MKRSRRQATFYILWSAALRLTAAALLCLPPAISEGADGDAGRFRASLVGGWNVPGNAFDGGGRVGLAAEADVWSLSSPTAGKAFAGLSLRWGEWSRSGLGGDDLAWSLAGRSWLTALRAGWRWSLAKGKVDPWVALEAGGAHYLARWRSVGVRDEVTAWVPSLGLAVGGDVILWPEGGLRAELGIEWTEANDDLLGRANLGGGRAMLGVVQRL